MKIINHMHYPRLSFSSAFGLLLTLALASSYFRPEAVLVNTNANGDIQIETTNIRFFDLTNKTSMPTPNNIENTQGTITHTKIKNGPIVYLVSSNTKPELKNTLNKQKSDSQNTEARKEAEAQSIYNKFPTIPEHLKKEKTDVTMTGILEINPEGKVVGVILKKPSKYPELNQLTIDSFKEWIFATNAKQNIKKEITINLRVE